MLPRCVTLLQDAHVRRIVEGYTRARQLLMRRHMQEPYQGREVSAVVHSVVIHARCQRCELRGGAWRQRCVQARPQMQCSGDMHGCAWHTGHRRYVCATFGERHVLVDVVAMSAHDIGD